MKHVVAHLKLASRSRQPLAVVVGCLMLSYLLFKENKLLPPHTLKPLILLANTNKTVYSNAITDTKK